MGDRAYEAVKPDNTYRISVVGDSFTFGPRMQPEDTFSKRLERWLNLNQQNPRVEVINRGISGTATHHQVNTVTQELSGKPDVIVLEITLNDAEEHQLTREQREAEFGTTAFDTPILKHIHLLRFIVTRLNNAESRRAYIRYHADSFTNPKTSQRFKNAVATIAERCKNSGVKLFAVVFPLFDFPFDERYPFTQTHELIGKTLQESGIPHLDLLSAFDGIPNERLLVLPGIDNHPNEIANRIAAERILMYMRRNHLIPPGSFPARAYKQRQNLQEKRMRFRGKKHTDEAGEVPQIEAQETPTESTTVQQPQE